MFDSFELSGRRSVLSSEVEVPMETTVGDGDIFFDMLVTQLEVSNSLQLLSSLNATVFLKPLNLFLDKSVLLVRSMTLST